MNIYFMDAVINEADAVQVMQWRNDPVTRSMFFHPHLRVMPDFLQEFSSYFAKDARCPQFACLNGKKVAFLRFEHIASCDEKTGEKSVEIDINLSPEYRGRGIGSLILERVSQRLFSSGIVSILATVKTVNKASVRAFENAGFRFKGAGDKLIPETGENVAVCYFEKSCVDKKIMKEIEEKVFVIAEAGSNWRMGTAERDMQMARKLIDVAADSGADAVKFQVYRPETTYVANAGKSDYLSEAEINDSINDIFADLAMPYEMIGELADYCQERQIEFMATPFSIRDAEMINPWVQRHKLASYEITHAPLLKYLAQTGRPLIMSTGAATITDIDWAVDFFFSNGGRELILLQCTAKYPAPPESLNLRSMQLLSNRYGLKSGLSDHSRDHINGPLAAVAMGASIIEKHFTLHNSLPGPDHTFAVTPVELREMISRIREVEKTLGQTVKYPQETENELRLFAQRGVQAIRDIDIGEIMRNGQNIEVLRPGKRLKGVHPKYLTKIEGCSAKRKIKCGDGIQPGDW
jgi:N-acetylneuraminate synthase